MPYLHAPVRYRSISGVVYDGLLRSAIREDGTCAIEVRAQPWHQPLMLTRVRWSEKPTEETATAWPR